VTLFFVSIDIDPDTTPICEVPKYACVSHRPQFVEDVCARSAAEAG
jgi:hypothetical protein